MQPLDPNRPHDLDDIIARMHTEAEGGVFEAMALAPAPCKMHAAEGLQMKIVDARSGEVLSIGKRIDYPNGEFIRLLRIEGDRVLLERAHRDFGKGAAGRLIEDAAWVSLIVRQGDHPAFPGQNVGFIPS